MKNIAKVLTFLILAGAVIAGVILVQKNQETRRGAAANATSSRVLPSALSKNLGDTFQVQVWFDTGSSSDLLDGAEFEIAYDATKLAYVGADFQNGYEDVSGVINNNGVLQFKVIKIARSSGGAIEVVLLNFKSLALGTQNIVVRNAKLQISNQSTLWNVPMNIASVLSILTPTSIPTPTATPTTAITRYTCNSVTYTCSLAANGAFINQASCQTNCVAPTAAPTLKPTLTPTMTPTSTPRPTAIPTPILILADVDGNGVVNLADFGLWKNEYLGKVTTKRADVDGNDVVNLADFGLWKNEYLGN